MKSAAGLDTCNGFDDVIPLVMAAVSRLEGNLEGGMIGGFEPRLQERDQILIHVFLEGLTCSTDLEQSTGVSMQTSEIQRTSSANCMHNMLSHWKHPENVAGLILLSGMEVRQDVMYQLVRF